MADEQAPINLDAYRSIGALQAQVMLLESQVSLLTAFLCAMLESSGAKRDELETRWQKHLGPILMKLGHWDDAHLKTSAETLAWLLAELRDGKL